MNNIQEAENKQANPLCLGIMCSVFFFRMIKCECMSQDVGIALLGTHEYESTQPYI